MSYRPPYEPHDSLIRPARTSAHPLRLLLGCVFVVAIYLSVALSFSQVLPEIFGDSFLRQSFENENRAYVLFLLFDFSFWILALTLVLRTLHRRTLTSLIGRTDRALAQFLRCTKFLLPLYAFILLMPMPEPFQLSVQMRLGEWLLWLPLALPLIMIQISAEELVFRGYLQSQIAAQLRHPIFWIGIPSVLFGLLHYSPAIAGENAWMMVVWATVFGAAAADLTARSGTLGPALALHFVNNIFGILLAAPLGNLDALALYTFPLSMDEPGLASVLLPLELMVTFCAWLAVRLALRA